MSRSVAEFLARIRAFSEILWTLKSRGGGLFLRKNPLGSRDSGQHQFRKYYSPAIAIRTFKSFITPACFCCAVCAAFSAPDAAQDRTDSSALRPVSAKTETLPRCQITGTQDIAIICNYTPMPLNAARSPHEPQIALNRVELSFGTTDSNWMRLELRFTKLDKRPISEARSVYIAFDDDSGHNFIRRPLPSVNLAALVTGKSADFQERLLVPALRPGHYQIKLWIPSVNPAFKFDYRHNLLVSSFGVADESSGLNRIAAFSVRR